MKNLLLRALALFFPILSFAQEAHVGLDKQINDWFEPIANVWESIVLYRIPLPGGVDAPMVVVLLVIGATFFTVAFSFVNITKFRLAIKVVSGDYDKFDTHASINPPGKETVNIVEGDVVDTIKVENQDGEVSHFQALATAVSGTVGLGNIAGVAVAIGMGGPGATFWMIICGLVGMSTKFVECTLGVKYRDIGPDGTVYGGPMYYLSKGLAQTGKKTFGKILAVLFAILCVGASFGGGNAFQSNQATAQIITLFGLKGGAAGVIIGLILAALTAVVIIGGIKRIATVTEKLVPFMAILYIAACLIVIFAHFSIIDDAIMLIMNKAFTMEAGLGGLIGVIIIGFQRAAFSNEAGAGSAAIAHSAVKTRYPASEGIVALLEPFIDTVVICTMTAVVIVIFNMTGAFDYGGIGSNVILNVPLGDFNAGDKIGGVDLTSFAFDDVLPGFSNVLTIAVFLFAFSTMISWSYYGLQSWKYLFGRGKNADLVYKVLFLIFIVIGAAATLDAVIKFSDAMILAMVFPNMIGLLLLFPKVREELKRYLSAIKIGKAKLAETQDE